MNYLSYVFGLILLVSAVFQPCDTHQNHPNQTRSALKTETIPITPTIIGQEKANFTKTIPTAEPTWDVDKKQQIAQTQTTLAIPAMTSEENTYLSITRPEWLRSNRAGDVAEIMEFGLTHLVWNMSRGTRAIISRTPHIIKNWLPLLRRKRPYCQSKTLTAGGEKALTRHRIWQLAWCQGSLTIFWDPKNTTPAFVAYWLYRH